MATCVDCANVLNGAAELDRCDTCDTDADNDCQPIDCNGVAGGSADVDDCGVCGGANECTDCAGVPNGPATIDNCGSCNADSTDHCALDCTGVWGGSASADSCGVCQGDSSSCADCAGIPDGTSTTDECGNCDDNDTNDCSADCTGVWGGTADLDACGLCGGDGSTCVVEFDESSPNALITLPLDASGISPGTDVSAAVAAMAQAIDADVGSFQITLQADVTLSQDASILSGDADALVLFQQSLRHDIAALLGGIGDDVEITSMAAGSIVVGFEMAVGAAHATATIPDIGATLQGEAIASSTVASVEAASVAFKISALSLADAGTDIVTALPLLNTAISEGGITGVSSELSVFSSLVMQCPVGYYTDPSGACSHCAVDENGHAQEPNAAQDGCIKCTDRVTSALMSWHSPIGAQCELCPIGRAPNEKRTACEPCVGNEYSDGQGMLCEPCGIGTQPSSDRSECVACEENYFSTVGTCDACPIGRFGVDSRGADPEAAVSSGANACEQCEVGAQGRRPARVACCAKLGSTA